MVNTRGVFTALRQPGSDKTIDFGITAAAKVENYLYVTELKVLVKGMECLFVPGAVWYVRFARNRKVEMDFPKGDFSIDGEQYHERGSYRPCRSGDAQLALYTQNMTDDWSGGKLKRKYHGSDKIGHVKLKPEAGNYTFLYTIKANQWIDLMFHSFSGESEIESVSITKE